MKTSCLSHPPRARLILIREEYLSITGGDHCAAALLAIIEYWTNWKLDHIAKRVEEFNEAGKDAAVIEREPWLYKNTKSFQEDLMGLFGRNKVLGGLSKLRELGYVSHRENPNHGWDHTFQYLLNIDLVQEKTDHWRRFKFKPSKVYKQTPLDLLLNDPESPSKPSKVPKQTADGLEKDEQYQSQQSESTESESTESESTATEVNTVAAAEIMAGFEIGEPALSKYQTLPLAQIKGWIEYARRKKLGPGYVVKRLAADEWAPDPPAPEPDPEFAAHAAAAAREAYQAAQQAAEAERQAERQAELEAAGVQPEDLKRWEKVLSQLKGTVTEATFDNNFRGSEPTRREDETLVIGLKDKYTLDWVTNRLGERIRVIAQDYGLSVEFEAIGAAQSKI